MNLYGVQSAEKNARCSVKKNLPVTGIVVPLLCCGLAFPGVSFSMQSGNTEAILGITFSAEHDDNIQLSSDAKTIADPEAEGEMVYHVMPSIDLTHAFGEHVLKFDLAGDSRSGGGNVASGLNIDTSVGLGLNFAGGLALSLVDTYAKDEFDMDLYDESGVSENQSNEYGFGAKYSFGRRLRAEAGYKHLWQEYNNNLKDIEYDTDTVTGKFTAPVAERLEAYVSGSFKSTESDSTITTNQNSDTMSGVLGARWEGPSILSGWIEGGYGDIDYETGTDDDDYSEAIGEVGVEVAFTPRSYMELSVGRNNYGDIKYSALLSHNYLDKMKINLSANQSTARSYSTTSSEKTYDVSLFRLSLATKFLERFEAGLTASYQMQDATDEVDTFVGRATLEYPIQEWVKVGVHYQYAKRTADNDADADADAAAKAKGYDDNRIGFFATFSL
jgi:hypothetical protein